MELLSKEKAKKEEEHAAKMDDVIVDVKASATVAVREAKVKLAEDVENAGS